ncbi:MAG TPA: SDR family NAD(P)-dependent oxidoreductase [Gaiellaceae bacterium]|nr:SDR family NAD(P)-dependent oxidoreductase [Gaiellaceae bacterium]
MSWTAPRLDERMALVTGATRGVGRGVALVLGEAGATVYVTGRTAVDEVAEEVTARGGRGVAARTDHTNDAQVEALFERIERESGRLDLVVGNAWGGYADHDWRTFSSPLWEQPLSRWQTMFESGLRSQLTTARFAAARMVEQGSGLVVLTGAWDDPGEYLGNLYYDVSKAAVSRLVAGLAHELGDRDVAVVGVVPGFTRTEAVVDAFAAGGMDPPDTAHSPEYVGRAIVHIAADPEAKALSGSSVQVATLGERYGFGDVDGRAFAEFRMPAENRLD